MKTVIRIVLVFAVGVFLIGTGTAMAETLQDAVKSVLQSNPEVTSAAYNRLGRDQEVREAMADFFPKLDTALSAGYISQNSPDNTSFRPRTATIRATQNVFRGGATVSETNRQKSRVASQAYTVQATSLYQGLLACRMYLNYLRAVEQDDLAKENVVIHERLYDQIKLRSQAGVDRRVDLEQITARLALAKSNLVVTAANVENAKTDYQAVVGHMPGTLVKPAPFDKEIPASIQDAEREALSNHPQLKSAKADIDARKFQHKTAKALTYPVIDVSAEYNWGDDINGPINFYHYQDWFSVNAMMRFNVFNGWYDQARIKETAYLINEAEEIAKKTERQTVQAVRLAYDAYKADERRITQLEQYVTSTGMTADAYISQWSIGRRTLFDVLDTSAERITAKSDLINAQYDKMYDSLRILQNMGKLLTVLGLSYPEESKVEYAGKIKEVKPKEEAKPAKVEEKVDGIWLREKK